MAQKKAYLVDFNIMMRVTHETDNTLSKEHNERLISEKALDKLREYVTTSGDFPYTENITSIVDDIEVPYGTLEDET